MSTVMATKKTKKNVLKQQQKTQRKKNMFFTSDMYARIKTHKGTVFQEATA